MKEPKSPSLRVKQRNDILGEKLAQRRIVLCESVKVDCREGLAREQQRRKNLLSSQLGDP